MRITRSLPVLAALVLAASALAVPAAAGSGHGGSRPRAHAASTYMTGIGDEQTQMFGSQLWKQLHMRIARYITPYDTVAHRDNLARATAWIRGAEEQHVKVLVAFYVSKHHPTSLPSVASYRLRAPVPGVERGQPQERPASLLEPLARRRGRLLPGAAARMHEVRGHRPRRARRTENRPHVELHRRIQARRQPPAHGHAQDLGPAQLLRCQPLPELAHQGTQPRAGRADLAHRDGRHRAVRRGLPQPQRLGPNPRRQGDPFHLRAGVIAAPDNASVPV